jgi:uncharacterized protein (TIGR00369 family)
MPANPGTPTEPPPAEQAGLAQARPPRAPWQPEVAPPLPGPALATLLGARVQATEGGAVLEMDVTPEVGNPLGNLHGGVSFAACDLAAQAALHAAGGPAQTASIRVSYPRPIPAGSTARFEARLLHRGRGLGIVSVTGTAGGGKPCVLATIMTGVAD